MIWYPDLNSPPRSSRPVLSSTTLTKTGQYVIHSNGGSKGPSRRSAARRTCHNVFKHIPACPSGSQIATDKSI